MKKAMVLSVFVFAIAWTSSASADDQSAGQADGTYKVRRGDRLAEVAARNGLTAEEILAANPQSAFGVRCGNPHNVTLRDGSKRAICGRPGFYLIAGKTLVIPASRTEDRTENVRLNAEVVALQAEMAELQKGREAEESELASLRVENDNLRDLNKTLIAAKAEIQGEHDELQTNFNAALARGPKQVEVRGINFIHIALTAVVMAFFFVLVSIIIVREKGKKEKEFERLTKRIQPSLSDQAEANKRRGAELDEQARKDEKRQRELNDLQAKLLEQKSEQDRQKTDLETREAALVTAQEELAKAKQAVADRETACTRREGEVQAGEERLKAGREAINHDWETLHAAERKATERSSELDGLQARLAAERAEVDTRLQTAADASTALERTSGDVTKRIDAVAVREIDAKRLEEKVAQREGAATAQEEELRRRTATVEDGERVLAARVVDIEARERACDTREGAFRAWEERLIDRERRITLDEGLPKAKGPHRPTLPPGMRVPLPCGPSNAAGVDDDNPTVTFPTPLDEEPPDPRAITGIEMSPGPTHTVESVDIEGERHLEPEPEPAAAPKDATPAPEGVNGDTPSCPPDEVYCTFCKKSYPASVYAAEHRAHDVGLLSPKE